MMMAVVSDLKYLWHTVFVNKLMHKKIDSKII